jgi:hypothetical protein
MTHTITGWMLMSESTRTSNTATADTVADAATCVNIENCPVFKHFGVFTREVYKELYCFGAYETCARYELKAKGEAVPRDLLPHGGRLKRK